MKRVRLPDGRRSEELAAQWHSLAEGDALTLEWPKPERPRRSK
jgi:hypothetical protein